MQSLEILYRQSISYDKILEVIELSGVWGIINKNIVSELPFSLCVLFIIVFALQLIALPVLINCMFVVCLVTVDLRALSTIFIIYTHTIAPTNPRCWNIRCICGNVGKSDVLKNWVVMSIWISQRCIPLLFVIYHTQMMTQKSKFALLHIKFSAYVFVLILYVLCCTPTYPTNSLQLFHIQKETIMTTTMAAAQQIYPPLWRRGHTKEFSLAINILDCP